MGLLGPQPTSRAPMNFVILVILTCSRINIYLHTFLLMNLVVSIENIGLGFNRAHSQINNKGLLKDLIIVNTMIILLD
jgi:hypothetical protein